MEEKRKPINAVNFKRSHISDVLTQREKEVLTLRFGLDHKEPLTLSEIGEIYGVTRERIRQIEGIAIRKIRNHPYADHLKEYLEGE